ncbi:MAG: DUF6240 domain-containing protein [Lachnospiraceae bacterium]|nr:DUF6240 domain-containing protein [Lachnospiraceae bacterium]
MRISFDNRDLAEVKKANQAYSQAPEVKSSGVSFAADISSAIPDSKAYENKKTSLSEFRDQIKDIDVSVNQDYMTVMAHTVSSEDYQRMTEDGVNPMECEVKDSVTIMDRIKLDVALGGGEIEGFTDTLDRETVQAMTGTGMTLELKREIASGGLEIPEYDITVDNDLIKESVEAFNELSEVTEMTDGMKRFFVSTEKEVSVENLYLAKHSALPPKMEDGQGPASSYFAIDDKGHLAKRGEAEDSAELKDQVKDLLGRLGIPADPETVENGTWLVNNSFCVNEESLEKLKEVNAVKLPVSEEDFVKYASIAISEGKSPKEAVLTKEENVYNMAVKLTRVMEETRLKMTSEANLLLLKSDYHIDTKDLEKYVDALKKVEASEEYKELKGIAEVKEAVEEIKALPAAVIAYLSSKPSDSMSSRPSDSMSSRPSGASGEIFYDIDSVSLGTVRDIGVPIKKKFDLAFETYEQVGTEVRRDLGDSIKKAFRNVDEILSETGMDITPENRRAVRILGYNSMPITKESVERIREADLKVTSVLNRITPEDTIKLIRGGKSPIDMSVKELNEYLDSKENIAKEEIEKYSKFLYKLEQNHEINPEERKQYIEVYRFFHQLEKSDLAAVGSVLNSGAELTIKNLKTAIKTAKNTGMDLKIDDSFGLLVSDIRNELSPEKIHAVEFSDETSLDTLYKNLAGADTTSEYDEAWNKEQCREMREAMKAPEEVVTELVENKVPVTAENLRAAYGLMKRRSGFFNGDLSDEAKAAADEIPEHFTDKESTLDAYTDMIGKTQDSLYESAMNADTYLDVRALKLAFTGMSVMRRYSESETYEVPMNLDGEETLVNLKVVHNPDEEANVVISSETEGLGRISARLFVKENEISGYISCNYKDTVTKMEQVADILSSNVKVVYSLNSDTDVTLSRIPMRRNDESVETGALYKAARQFLLALKNAQ